MLYANTGTHPRQAATDLHAFDTAAVWIDLLDPTEDERSATERACGLRVPTRDDIAEIESSSRLYKEGDVLFLSTTAAYRGEDKRSHTAPLGFVLSRDRLVTIRFAALPVFDSYAESFTHGHGAGSVDAFVGLLEALVDRLADVLERVAGELDAVSKQTFRSDASGSRMGSRRKDHVLRAALVQIGESGDTLGNLRDSLLGVGRMVGYVMEMAAPWLDSGLMTRLGTLKRDIGSLNDYDQQLTGKLSFLLDAVMGFIGIQQNDGVKVLTVVSVVGIPPTLIASMYGMNFKNIPEYDWSYGYQYGLTLIALSIVCPLIWFRIKGWL